MNRLRLLASICMALILTLLCEAVAERAIVEEAASLEYVIQVPDDFRSIQEAVDEAQEGDEVEVHPGTYFEHVLVNKSVSISGTDRLRVIVDGGGAGVAFSLVGSDIHVRNFTIKNCETGIYVRKSSRCTISENLVEDCDYGIRVSRSSNCTIRSNHALRNAGYGINVNASQSILVEDNGASENYFDGLGLLMSSNCTLRGNTVSDNELFGIWVDSSSMNVIFHNNVFGNGMQTSSNTANRWSSDQEGNYWGDYSGVDRLGNDGVGDEPYIVDEETGQQDDFPLMQPFVNAAYLDIDTEPPTARFTYTPQEASVGENMSFDASNCDDTVGKNSIVDYIWDFGDEVEASGIVVDHSYTEGGNYTITLTITDAAGNENRTFKVVEIHSSAAKPIDGRLLLLGVAGGIVVAVLLFILWRRGRQPHP